MIPPKIEICIEGYNIEQTDFYIAHIIDKYNSLNELYQKSCEHIVFLEKECKNGFNIALSESEKRLSDKLELLENRLNEIEKILNVSINKSNDSTFEKKESENNEDQMKNIISDFRSELEEIKSLF